MNDKHKTKAQLITELQELRRRVAQMEEAGKSQHNHAPFRAWAETAASAIFIFQDSVFRYSNPATSKLTGYTAEELLGANIWNLVHPEHRELINARVLAWQRGEPVPPRSEFKILTKSGETRWINADSTFIEFAGNPAALTIAYDTTDNKRAEEALNESEERFRKIIETAQEAIWAVDAEANTTYVNQRLAEMLGYTRDELLGRSVLDFVDDADRLETVKYLERGRSGIKEQHDSRFRCRDGSELWTMVSTTPLFDGAGMFVGGLAMLIDITERKRAERALKESEARLQAVIVNLPFEVWARDNNGRCTMQNAYTRLQWGNLTGKLPEETAPDRETLAFWESANRRAFAGEVVKAEFEITQGEQAGYYYSVVAPIRVDGEVRGIVGASIDITERKRAEKALRESEAKFRILAETASSIIYILQGSRCVYVNPYSVAYSGYSEGELLSMDFWEIVHPEYRELVRERLRARLRGETAPSHYGIKIIIKSGEERWIDFAASPICFEGKPSLLGTAFDVTDRKRAEEALRKTQERLQHVLSFSPAIIYLLNVEDESFTPEWVSQSLTRLTGYERGEALSEGWWVDHIHPDDRGRVLAEMPRLFTGDRMVHEYRFRHKDGGYLWLHDESRLLRDESGKPVETIGSCVDVTERREAEAALRDSEERFRTLVSSMDDIVFTVDRHQRHTGGFGRWIERLGIERGVFIGKTASEVLGPDAGLIHEEANARALTGERVIYEWSLASNRETRHFQTSLSPIHNQGGDVTGLVGVGRDITERKRAEEVLRRQTARLAALHEIELEISAESELSRVLDVVTCRAAELLNAYHCSVYIRDGEQAKLNLVASLDSGLIGLRLKEGEGLAGLVAVAGEALAVENYSEWHGRAAMFDGKGFGPSLSAPLKWQHTVIGAISLARRQGEERFTDDDIRFMEQIAADAAIAIHQASLFGEVQEGRWRLQVLSHRLIEAQEAERKRLARELHDQIGQALTAVQISLQALRPPLDSVVSAQRLEESLAIIDDALQQVHDLSLDLRPSMLDDLGLVAALRWYVDRVASISGLADRFNAGDLRVRLAPEVETACFRIAQEALTNVLRHAHATGVWVDVKHSNSDLRLLIRDDGVGFDVRAAMSRTGTNASLGLQGMRERAAALGGLVDIKSKQGRGTEVQASFPLKQSRSS